MKRKRGEKIKTVILPYGRGMGRTYGEKKIRKKKYY